MPPTNGLRNALMMMILTACIVALILTLQLTHITQDSLKLALSMTATLVTLYTMCHRRTSRK